MQLLIGLLIAIALGYQAKQKGRDGLKFGAGVATALLVPLAAIQFWDQAVGAHPALWWVVAALVTYLAWSRLAKPESADNPKGMVQGQAPTSTSRDDDQSEGRAVSKPADVSTSPKPWSMDEVRFLWSQQQEYFKANKLKATARALYMTLILGNVLYWGGRAIIGEVQETRAAAEEQNTTRANVNNKTINPQPSIAESTPPAGNSTSNPRFPLDKNGEPIVSFAAGQPVWQCKNMNSGAHWRDMQFRSDGVYLYKGEASGWGLYRWEGKTILHMTADETDRWIVWSVQTDQAAELQISNQFGLTVNCRLI